MKRKSARTNTPGQLVAAVLLGVLGMIVTVGQSPQADASPPRASLPYANGRTFQTLDAYLEHLRAQGTIGVPHYHEVKPGFYERRESVRFGKQPLLLSRADLLKRYGFDR